MEETEMQIQIVGYGVVGKAQEFLMRKLGHRVTAYDPLVLPDSRIQQDLDITFISTPEEAVEDVVSNLNSSKVKGLYVIKSTVPVGTTKLLSEKYKVHMCHNPEFLREKHAFQNAINPSRIIIGQCCKAHGQMLADLYKPLNKPTFLTTPTVSELAKLTSNAYLSTLITLWNEIAELTKKLGVPVKELVELVCADSRMSRHGTKFFGQPFKGKCLPKDLEHLIAGYHNKGLNPILFEAVKKFNDKMEKENYVA